MPSKARSQRQAKRERNALRKLVSTGLYSKKLDLRKSVTPYQRRLISKYADVLAGKATVVRPAEPATFKGLFRVVGNAVIVPRREGERITVSGGKIKSTRRTKRGTVKSTYVRVKAGATIKRPKEAVQYAIPFNRGDHLEWMRHPSFDALKKFMSEYAKYKGWKKYAIGENNSELKENEMDFEDDEDLTYVLEEKLGPQYGASGGRYPGPKKKKRTPRQRKKGR